MNQKAVIAAAVVVVAALGFGAYSYFGRTTSIVDPSAMAAPAQAAAPAPAYSFHQVTKLPSTPDILPQRILGRADAPVTMLEFASLTCGHCANFDQHTLPELKKKYIDTGKMRLVFRDFPLGQLSLVAAMVPHCAPADQYFGFLNLLFHTMPTWATSSNPLGEISKVVRIGGLSQEAVHACFNNQALFNAIRDRAEADSKEFGIDSTPSFIIDGVKIVGNQSVEEFSKVIDAAIAAAE